MARSSVQNDASQVLRFGHPEHAICWFSILPDKTGILCKCQAGNNRFVVLDTETLTKKQKLAQKGKEFLVTPTHRHFPNGVSFIIPGFETICIKTFLGQKTILIELIWGRGTTTAYVMTSEVDLRNSSVTAVNQRTLPVQNGPTNWNFDMCRDNEREDHFYCIFYWPKDGKTALSLARINVSSSAGEINCEEIANERLIGQDGWVTGAVCVMENVIYLLNGNGPINQMLKHSLDGSFTSFSALKSYIGEYPQNGYMIQGWFDGCMIAFIHPDCKPSGKIWALEVRTCQWLSLGVVIAEHIPCGHNKMIITPTGKVYLIAMCDEKIRCQSKAHVYVFNIKTRLQEAKAALETGPPSLSIDAPPPYA